MNPITLPLDDTSPSTITSQDIALKQQFEQSTSRHFFEACTGLLQSVLMECQWTLRVAEVLVLEVYCPDMRSNWRVLNHITKLAERLSQFSVSAKIRVYPPDESTEPFEMRVDERAVYSLS